MTVRDHQCAGCLHFHAWDRTGNFCDAFPDKPGIPDEIPFGDFDHHNPHVGDHGIRFEAGDPQFTKHAAFTAHDVSGEARDNHGKWTAGGASHSAPGGSPSGGGVAVQAHTDPRASQMGSRSVTGQVETRTPGWEGAGGANAAGGLKADNPHAVVASLGLTPFRGEGQPALENVRGYFNTTRFRGFEHELKTYSTAHGIQTVDESRAAGMWEGKLEPSLSITVRGTDTAIHDLAAHMGSRYYQDAVMVFTPDEQTPNGGMYVLDNMDDPHKALLAMQDAGIHGARIVGRRLEIADDEGTMVHQVATLKDSLGLQAKFIHGRVEWVSAGTDYKRGAR